MMTPANQAAFETIAAMWPTHSATAIAVELGQGFTRNRVIGIAQRHGLSAKRPSAKPRVTKQVLARAEKAQARAKVKAEAPAADAPLPEAPPPEKPERPKPVAAMDEPATTRREPGAGPAHLLLDTGLPPGARHCRYPFGEPSGPDFHYCGRLATRAASSSPIAVYCDEHHALTRQRG